MVGLGENVWALPKIFPLFSPYQIAHNPIISPLFSIIHISPPTKHSLSLLFFFFFLMNKKKGLTRVIIDLTHLNSLLMAWGTPRHVRDIRIVAQHFCEVHNLNLTTLALVGVTKSRTPTNTPQLKSTWRDLLWRYDLEGPRKDFGTLLGSKEEERGFGAYTRPWAHKYAMCKSKSKK